MIVYLKESSCREMRSKNVMHSLDINDTAAPCKVHYERMFTMGIYIGEWSGFCRGSLKCPLSEWVSYWNHVWKEFLGEMDLLLEFEKSSLDLGERE
jgi:hypothetical protein